MFSSTALVIIAVAVVATALGLTIGFVIGVYHVFRTEQQEAALAAAEPWGPPTRREVPFDALVRQRADEMAAENADEFTARMAATAAEIDGLVQRLQQAPECDGSDWCDALMHNPGCWSAPKN